MITKGGLTPQLLEQVCGKEALAMIGNMTKYTVKRDEEIKRIPDDAWPEPDTDAILRQKPQMRKLVA